MPGRYSRRKGQRFEQKVAALFTEWSKHKFVRTRGSGSWEKVPGDVCLLHEEEQLFPFVVECKNVEVKDFTLLVFSSQGKQWWKQASEEAKKVGKHPLLVCSRSYFPEILLFMEKSVFDRLPAKPRNLVLSREIWGRVCVLCLIRELFSLVSFEDFVEAGA